ncbi:Oxygen tolerance [Mucilaginibacter mallensis]|uniref:Oxygen tolerance n=1 Tax=Mucilaginibacter mallensis TaxID=652787 RepID=A0A1H2BQ20_MUCMA|nr:BatD family protein [Mucilaginibacter mallensis]SDT59846.1 Oxygen tolerance [Mucilaginibacter mallensis]
MKKGYYILSFLLLWTTLLFADPKFTAIASKSEVAVGEQFEVDFSLDGGGEHFIPPDFRGFQVLSGPNPSTSMTSINGVTTYNTTYGYIVTATKEGTLTIDAAAIISAGHTLTTNSLKIKVKGQFTQAQQQAQQQQGIQPAASAPADDAQPATQDLSKQLFIRAEVDKSNVYVGEQITLDYKLYTRVGILASQPDKAPDLNGFWNQDVVNKDQQHPVWKTEMYKGLKYNTVVIKQTVLFPEHAGDLIIDPFAITFLAQIQLPSRNMLDDMYGNVKNVKYQAKSTPLTIHVNPLPEAGKPANFSGAVGEFAVYADADKRELKANETLNYTFEITGKGNLNLINAPKLNPPVDFEKYDPKTDDHITVDATGVSGSRKYSYLLIPRHQGDYTLNSVDFSYFNPATKRYVTLPSKAFSIKVNKGDVQVNVPAFNSADQQDIKMLGNDIRYIKSSSPGLYKEGDGFYNSALFYVLLLLGPTLFAGAFFYRSWLTQYNSDAVLVKSRLANKIAAKHLAAAQKELTTGNKQAFYEAIAKGLFGYLSDKLNIPAADLNRENIADKMKAKSLDGTLIKKLEDTMDMCEMARFAPSTSIAQQEVFENAKNIINEIEDKI